MIMYVLRGFYASTIHSVLCLRPASALVGAGISNMPIIELFAAAGVPVIVRDRKLRDGEREKLRALGAALSEGEDYLHGIDEPLLFLSPAVRPDLPELVAARANGTHVTTEMEEFFELCPCPITAVTAATGKRRRPR